MGGRYLVENVDCETKLKQKRTVNYYVIELSYRQGERPMANCPACNKNLVMSPGRAQRQDGLTDWLTDWLTDRPTALHCKLTVTLTAENLYLLVNILLWK
jgi:hypothetical protein